MNAYLKTVAGVLVSVVLILALDKQVSGMLLAAIVCTMTAAIAISYLEPVKELLQQLEELADLQNGCIGILLKCAGIGLVSELTGLFCQDAGLSSMKKTIQFLGNCTILYLSVPAFEALLTLLTDILSEI